MHIATLQGGGGTAQTDVDSSPCETPARVQPAFLKKPHALRSSERGHARGPCGGSFFLPRNRQRAAKVMLECETRKQLIARIGRKSPCAIIVTERVNVSKYGIYSPLVWCWRGVCSVRH